MQHKPEREIGKYQSFLIKYFNINFHFNYSEGDLRIIRPFIYTREGHLEDFSIHKQLPSRPSKILTRALDGSNSILKVQAVINPHVYENIKHALKPLLSLKLELALFENI